MKSSWTVHFCEQAGCSFVNSEKWQLFENRDNIYLYAIYAPAPCKPWPMTLFYDALNLKNNPNGLEAVDLEIVNDKHPVLQPICIYPDITVIICKLLWGQSGYQHAPR